MDREEQDERRRPARQDQKQQMQYCETCASQHESRLCAKMPNAEDTPRPLPIRSRRLVGQITNAIPNGDQRDSVPVREINDRRLINQNGLVRLHGQHAPPGGKY